MPLKVHRPEIKNPTLNIPENTPLLFFAGPIVGTEDWQDRAVFRTSVIADQSIPTTVHVANPRWTNIPDSHRLEPAAQRTWEKQHYRYAALSGGVVAFWIAAESSKAPVPNPENRAYGQGTRSEFSEVIGMRLVKPEVNIVLGIDQNHSGRGLNEYRHTAEEFGIYIHTSLGSVCISALELMLPRTKR